MIERVMLVLLLATIGGLVSGCQLFDNSIKGSVSVTQPTAPPSELTNISLLINDCFESPPEDLFYSCQIIAEGVYGQSTGKVLQNNAKMLVRANGFKHKAHDVKPKANEVKHKGNDVIYSASEGPGGAIHKSKTLGESIAENVTYQLSNNSCMGLSINNSGQLSGRLEQLATEACSLTIRAFVGSIVTEKTLNLVVDTALSLSFDQENIFIKEGEVETILTLSLSSPAPYDSFVDFDVYGNQTEVISGLMFDSKRINIAKGESQVQLSLLVPGGAGVTTAIHQKILLSSGGQQPLPAVSLNTYASGVALPDFQSLAVGYSHTCGISSGKLFCWGSDSSGQLGLVSVSSFIGHLAHPRQVGIKSTWSLVSAGNEFTCGINDDGLYCWGSDAYGKIGNGVATGDIDTPFQVDASSTWSDITTGGDHACGIKGGDLYCWGRDNTDQLGDGATLTDLDVPTQIVGLTNWTAVAAGDQHTCAIDSDELYCWGEDSSNQLGNGAGTAIVPAPLKVDDTRVWQDLSAASFHTCGIADSGKLFCWGNSSYGRLGLGVSAYIPAQVGASSQWSKIAAGRDTTCGIDGGQLFCWGRDHYGQLGNGSLTSTAVPSPESVNGSLLWTQIIVSDFHVCGVNDSKLYCWGGGGRGQVGSGDAAEILETPRLNGSSVTWDSLAAGTNHTCGLNKGQLYCWGSDRYHQVGNGDGSSSIVGTPLPIGSNKDWSQVSAGEYHSCGIRMGKLFCWGTDNFGELGNNGTGGEQTEPVQVGTQSNWTSISVNLTNSCGLKNGELWCWGKDEFEQLGDGAGMADTNFPGQVGASNLWTQVSVGRTHICGIQSKALYCWGQDGNGQSGNPAAVTPIDVPKRVGLSNTWSWISAGSNHTCGIDNKELYCWGKDNDGQVGNDNSLSADVDTPIKIGSFQDWDQLSISGNHSCGLRGGRLYCWGADKFGEVGNGSPFTDVHDPTQVGASSNWTEVSSGLNHVCGINAGQSFCWGRSTNAQGGNISGFLNVPFLVIGWE